MLSQQRNRRGSILAPVAYLLLLMGAFLIVMFINDVSGLMTSLNRVKSAADAASLTAANELASLRDSELGMGDAAVVGNAARDFADSYYARTCASAISGAFAEAGNLPPNATRINEPECLAMVYAKASSQLIHPLLRDGATVPANAATALPGLTPNAAGSSRNLCYTTTGTFFAANNCGGPAALAPIMNLTWRFQVAPYNDPLCRQAAPAANDVDKDFCVVTTITFDNEPLWTRNLAPFVAVRGVMGGREIVSKAVVLRPRVVTIANTSPLSKFQVANAAGQTQLVNDYQRSGNLGSDAIFLETFVP